MILVGQYDSPFVRRIAVTLHTLGIPFERNMISAFADAEQMRTINPLGRIPTLILDDGERLYDSHFILDHLDELAGPARALLPAAGAERRRALRIIAVASGALEKTGAMVYERTLRPPDKRHAPWLERCATQVTGGLAYLESLTPAAGWYLGGATPTQPDLTVGCILSYYPRTAPDLFDAIRYPHLDALRSRFESLPAAALTVPSADESMPARPL
jgi:glutathione S-transferase